MRRLEKKEMERIARRFKVITPAEFDQNLATVRENFGQGGDKKNDPSASNGDGPSD